MSVKMKRPNKKNKELYLYNYLQDIICFKKTKKENNHLGKVFDALQANGMKQRRKK